MQIIAIDKKRYIAGCHWQTVEGGSSKAKQMLTQAQKLNSMIRGGNNAVFLGRRQYGLVTVSSKKIPAQPSLASSIRESGIDDALLKFCLSDKGDLWYVVAISGNLILPAGDSIFKTESEADDLVVEITSSYEFELVKSFEDAAAAFEFIESNITPHLKLRILHDTSIGKNIGIASVVLILGFGGYQGFQHYQKIKANKEEALYFAQQAAMKTQKIEAIQSKLGEYFPPVYKEKPRAQDVIETCRKNVSGLPINSKGWANSGYACTANTYFAYWKYKEGCSFLVLPIYTKVNPSTPQKPLPLSQIFEHEYVKSGDVKLLTVEGAFSRLSEWARLVRGKLTISWDVPAKKLVGKDAYFEGVEVESPFSIGHWQMDIENTPYLGDLPPNTQNIPGLVLNNIDKKDKFLIQGEIYVQSI